MQNIEAKNFYNYFKDCYQLDYKEFIVENILSSKYQYKWFVKGAEELLSQELPLIPYDNKKGNNLEKDLELFKLEKSLFYAAHFVLGLSDNYLIKDKRFCAPLVLYPTKLINDDGFYYIKIEYNNPQINRAVLSKLNLKDTQLSKDEFVSAFLEKHHLHPENLAWLGRLLEKYFSNIEQEDLLLYPNVWSASKVRKYFTENDLENGSYKIIPAAGTIFIEKSTSSLAVLQDLEAMSSQNTFCNSINELLHQETTEKNFDVSYFRTKLNAEQYKALENSYKFTNSIIIGPPGTGKSYTISAIVADAISKNKSVLVVSKTKQAVEVIRDLLDKEYKLKKHVIHTTGHGYKYSLIRKIRNYLTGINVINDYQYDSIIGNYYEKLIEKEHLFNFLVEQELELSDLTFKDDITFTEKIYRFFLDYKHEFGHDIWDVYEEISLLINKLNKIYKKSIPHKVTRRIMNMLDVHRTDLAQYLDGLESSNFTSSQEIIDDIDFKNILSIFPIWLANLSNLNNVLPLQKELFDLVIIDECTQCDIASALPAIYRAKHVIVSGDPNQLKHYSFVSRFQQQDAQNKYNLPNHPMFDYRDRSILDLFISRVKSQEQVTFLKEHFRSTPSLIQFSNEQFYENQLKIIKSTPKFMNQSQLELIQVNGERDKKGINEIEAQKVMEVLQNHIKTHKEKYKISSIGIVSPFNSQARFITSLIQEHIPTNLIKKFNIKCGTPYQFQGSERDFIIISFGVCPRTHHSAFIHASKSEVLNVGITRAKSFQYIITSLTKKDRKSDNLLNQYLNSVEDNLIQNKNLISTEKDTFQEEVILTLKQKELDEIHFGYPVAGSVLDILIVNKNKNYFIDLIGYPGEYKEAFSMERYQTLNRVGINSLPLHYSFWKKKRNLAEKRLFHFLR